MGRTGVRWSWLWTLAAAAALGGCSSDPPPAATVLVDYDHDEFATQFLRFLPDHVQVHPGDRVTFSQAWTGEPHTVTFGSSVAGVLEVTRPLVAEYGHLPIDEVPEDVLDTFFEAERQLPPFWIETEGDADEAPQESLSQAAAQPCQIAAGGQLPADGSRCEDRELAPFTGTEAYYNSGVIPYEGPGNNVFEFEVSEDIAPGTYPFYCAVHGSFQSGTLEVVPPEQPLPDPTERAEDLRREVNQLIEPYATTFRDAASGRYRFAGREHDWNYAGLLREDAPEEGIVNEFVPAVVEATVDEPVTWRMFGPHSISFDVPEYLPIVEFLDDGTVRTNDAVYEATGGAPEVEEPEDPSQPVVVDGGTYDGEGFWSTGVLDSEAYVEYTLRVSRPGTYRFACLIHPPMVGTLRVAPG